MNHYKLILGLGAIVGLSLAWPAVSQLRVQPPQQQQQQPQRAARAVPWISVVEFGANGQDDRWDSDAIQRAVDSLPRPSGPGTKAPSGGVVVLPAGRYTLNKPIRIFSGVTLRGEGPGTVLHAATDAPAILLVSPFGHRYIASATVEELTIYTDKSPGIVVDASVTNTVQCRFENLLISAAGCAIDLDPGRAQKIYTQNTVVRNVFVSRFGGPALQIWGNANHIEQLNTEGGTRDGFKADPAIVSVAGGQNDIRSCIIEANTPNPAVAFHVSGTFTWSHNWVELHPTTDGVAYIFEDVEWGLIDNLHHLLPWHKPVFRNCTLIHIDLLNTDGELAPLSACMEIDDKSNIRIDQVLARMDVGMLDDPRVSIGATVNKTAGTRVEQPQSRANGVNLVPDAQNWNAKWNVAGDAQARIAGDAKVEADNCLRVQIRENAPKRPLAVEVKLNVPLEIVGKACVLRYRIDGPGQALVYHNEKQVATRVMNSATACVLPAPVKEGDRIEFILPPEQGTYVISDASVTPK